jgi:glycosyltransferase involved in cell wall biosynthesis
MRILILIHEFPPVGGGGGRVAQDISQALVRRGHEVAILTAHLKGLPRQENVGGVQVIRIPSLRRQSYRADMAAMAAYIVAGLWAGCRLIRRWRPDVIHVHFAVPAGALAWALSRLTRVPYVLTTHLGDVPGGVPDKTSGWFRWLLPFTPPIWKAARYVTAVSEFTRQLALQHYPVDIRVVPNGVDLQSLKPEKIAIQDPPVIVFAGRFVPQKNPLQIVATLAGMQDLSWRCAMLGDGPLLKEVKQAIGRYGLEGRFTLMDGWVTPEEVIARFSKSDILFMPSLSEGLPVVGVQALAMGLAIVAGRVGGFLGLVEQGKNGFLCAPDDRAGLEAALRTLLADKSTLLSARSESRRLAERFDLLRIVDTYEAIFRETGR